MVFTRHFSTWWSRRIMAIFSDEIDMLTPEQREPTGRAALGGGTPPPPQEVPAGERPAPRAAAVAHHHPGGW